jgi:DNA-binding transcriptional LysR family regulator
LVYATRCAGMGVSNLPSAAVENDLRSGDLSALQWVEPFAVVTRMARHPKRWQSPALRAFLEAAREVFGHALTPDSLAGLRAQRPAEERARARIL